MAPPCFQRTVRIGCVTIENGWPFDEEGEVSQTIRSVCVRMKKAVNDDKKLKEKIKRLKDIFKRSQ